MELLREAAGMVPDLEKMAFRGGFLVLVVVFPADKCWNFPDGSVI